MSNFIYVNGQYYRKENARVFVNDRGYQFGDSVYEVVLFRNNIFYDFKDHIDRLRRSLSSLDFNLNKTDKVLFLICKYLIKLNKISFGSVYIQVSRGVFDRDHSYKNMKLSPVLVIITKNNKTDFLKNANGIKTITMNDTRWKHPDIKTTQLLPNVLAKTQANRNNADEAIFLDDKGFVTEGSSSNVWILDNEDNLFTRNLDGSILPGITRKTIFECAKLNQIKIIEKKFTLNELYNAKEVFISSASSFVTPVNRVDDKKIGNGEVGFFSKTLRKTYFEIFE